MGVWLGRIAFSLAFGGAGLYMLRAAALVWMQRQKWNAEGIVADGEIVAFESKSMSGDRAGKALDFPVIRFSLPTGAPIRFTSSRGERPNPYTIGQRVAVRYLPADPNSADLDAVTRSWFSFIALLICGIVALVVATLPFILR